jgi:asparagine synthetase B (glutamine-hydrolysing)
MYQVVDLRKFENYFFSAHCSDNFYSDIKNFPTRGGVFGMLERKGYLLTLARDLFGEMPLYFLVAKSHKKIYVANTVADLMGQTCYSYDRVRSVPTAHLVQLSLENGSYRYRRFYRSYTMRLSANLDTVTHSISERLKKAIKSRLPTQSEEIAVLLSGGVDSFSVSYLLNRIRKDVVAYTLTVDGQGKDFLNAQRAAQFLNIPLIQVDVSSKEIVDSIQQVIELCELYKDYDVYMAVGSYLLGKALKKDGIKHVFTGEGANELFGDYQPWGSFQTPASEITSKKFRKLMVFGRNPHDKYYNCQLGSGFGRSLSRLNKVLFHFGLKVYNPFMDIAVVEYILDLSKIFVMQYPKQKLFQDAFKEVPQELFPDKIRLQDGSGISNVLFRDKIDHTVLERKFSKIFQASEH